VLLQAPGPRLPAENRPQEIAEWFKYDRCKALFVIGRAWLPKLSTEWWSWWKLMQPEGRVAPDGSLLQPAEKLDWDCLRVSGKNGLLSAVMILRCWGLCVAEDPVDSPERLDWASAVVEACWAFKTMLQTPVDRHSQSPLPSPKR